MYIIMASNINTIAVQLAGFLLEDIKGGGGRVGKINHRESLGNDSMHFKIWKLIGFCCVSCRCGRAVAAQKATTYCHFSSHYHQLHRPDCWRGGATHPSPWGVLCLLHQLPRGISLHRNNHLCNQL